MQTLVKGKTGVTPKRNLPAYSTFSDRDFLVQDRWNTLGNASQLLRR